MVRLIYAALACLACLPESSAATFKFDLDAKSCQLQLDGDIKEGDLQRLKAELKDYEPSFAGPTLCLNSSGGDFVEALEIANLVATGFSTEIKPNAVCESACGWIFLSGTNWTTDGSGLSRVMSTASNLTFHAPYLDPSAFPSKPSEELSPIAILQAYNQAVSEMARGLLRLAERRTTQDILPLVPSSLMAQALLKTGAQALEINMTGQTIRWDITVEGYDGVVPTSKADVVQACNIAQAKANENWEVSFPKAEGYLAYYNSTKREFTAQVTLEGSGQDACELKFTYDESLRHLSSPITVTANLTFESSLGLRWIKGMRDSKDVVLPDFAFLDARTPLRNIAIRQASSINPSALVTLGVPGWCNAQTSKEIDERAICRDGQLSALDILLNEYYKLYLKILPTRTARGQLGNEASNWRASRKRCGENTVCLEQVYRSAIVSLRNRIFDARIAAETRRCEGQLDNCPAIDVDYPGDRPP